MMKAETFIPASGTANTWNLSSNWVEGTIPNGVGAAAIFNSPTANRTITLDAPITVGSILFNISANFTNALNNGTGGSLVLDAAGPGPALITTDGTTTSLITMGATQTWNDSVTINTISATSASVAGALTLTGAVTGAGGLTKDGPGTMTMGTVAKTYTGPTLVNGGRLRLSAIGAPGSSSSVTIASGGQITFTGNQGTFTLGASSLNLNGTGSAAFPGALRVDVVGAVIPNAIVLQSASSINVPGSTSTLLLQGSISGAGKLEVGALPGDPLAQGTLSLDGNNSYTGGTLVTQGTLVVNAVSADLGTGNVTVDGVSTGPSGSVANGKLTIQTGVINAIDDFATLILMGGSGTGAADGGFITLLAGVNETVGGLILGGVPQGPGTYGSTASIATYKSAAFDEFFSSGGSGIITVVPEPGATVLLLGSFGTLLGLQRVRRGR